MAITNKLSHGTDYVELEGTSESLKNWYSKMIAKGPISDEEWEDWKEANL